MKRLSIVVIVVLIGFTTSSCSNLSEKSTSQGTVQQSPNQENISNGELLYFRAVDESGNMISYTGGPSFGGMMMGSYLTCASCHGPDAHGGQHIMHMQVMDAPPIYYDALKAMMMEESGGTAQPEGYTLEDFNTAVIQGEHPDGDKLSTDMPRWQMNDQDLGDLFAFLKTIAQ